MNPLRSFASAALVASNTGRAIRPTSVARGPMSCGQFGGGLRSCAWCALIIGWAATVDAAVIDDFVITSGTAAIPYHVNVVYPSASASTSLVGNYIFDTRSVVISETLVNSPYVFFNSNSFSFPSGAGMARIEQSLLATVAGGGHQSMVITYSNADGHAVDLSGVNSFQLTRSNPFSAGGGPDGSGTGLYFSVVTSSGDYMAPLESRLSTEFISGIADLALTDFKLGGSFWGAHLSKVALSSVSAVKLVQYSDASAVGSGYRTIDLTGIRAVPEPIIGPPGVPEIAPTSLGSALALVLGSLGLLERRRLNAA